jgi:hypothetical protein
MIFMRIVAASVIAGALTADVTGLTVAFGLALLLLTGAVVFGASLFFAWAFDVKLIMLNNKAAIKILDLFIVRFFILDLLVK